ncbi:hypothetical protein L6452_16422 [Arctium lappa]|uniref:Uncharacterized protein n=1 Tax=Arctium lappa TaxID=4217 RepID=A0ACB9C0H5_ARCLA|nr:hypothetical protein L6452_16422 [Arctium lappa]
MEVCANWFSLAIKEADGQRCSSNLELDDSISSHELVDNPSDKDNTGTCNTRVTSYDEARMKIYSVSTRCYYAFGALMSEELCYKISTRCYYAFGALMSEELCYKINDSFCIHTPFGSNPNGHFFVVFDGHGEFGAQCSQFVKQRLCENLLRNSRFHSDLVEACHVSFLTTISQLHADNIIEIVALELTPDDLFFVIASDEVFEFLSSQVVVDMDLTPKFSQLPSLDKIVDQALKHSYANVSNNTQMQGNNPKYSQFKDL